MTTHLKNYETLRLNGSSFNWFQGNKLQISNTAAPDNKTVDKDNDLFDPWNGFASILWLMDKELNLTIAVC